MVRIVTMCKSSHIVSIYPLILLRSNDRVTSRSYERRNPTLRTEVAPSKQNDLVLQAHR